MAWLSRLLAPCVEPLLLPVLNHGSFRQVFRQDIAATEEEQRAHLLADGRDLGRDPNPVTHAVRRAIVAHTAGRGPLLPEPELPGDGGPR